MPPATLIVVLGGLLSMEFGKIISCPSCYLIVNSGDGLKNYYTPSYFVKYDEGLWFSGMNYPYGEHIVYTDNQPIISSSIKLLSTVLPLENDVIGIIHVLLLLSILIAGLCIYHILRKLSLPRWYAALVAIPITIMSPQIFRFASHYSLAYVCYYPIFLLLFINFLERIKQGGKWLRPGVLLGLWIAWMGFTHLYYFFTASAFLGFYLVAHFVLNRFRWDRLLTTLTVLLIVSAAFIYGTVKITDPVTDRPGEAWGVHVFSANPAGTLLPWYRPFKDIWPDLLNASPPNVENHSYLGAAVVLVTPVLLYMMGWLVYRVMRRNSPRKYSRRWATRHAGHPLVLVLAAALMWVFAAGWYYELMNDWILQQLPVLTQFRSLGRLVWMICLVMGISTAWLLYRWIRVAKTWRGARRVMAFVGIGLLISLWLVESVRVYQSYIPTHRFENDRLGKTTTYPDFLASKQINPDDYQSILVLPLTVVGSEKYADDRGMWWLRQGFKMSWETGLPLLDYQMSRTSLSQTCDLIQLLSDDHIPKDRLKSMDNRPIFLIAGDEKNMTGAEKRLIGKADLLGELDDIRLYTLSLSAFNVSPTPIDSNILVSMNFNDLTTEKALSGNGAMQITQSPHQLFSLVDTFSAGATLRFSSWSYLGPQTPVFAAVTHQSQVQDGSTKKVGDYSMYHFKPHNVIGDWVETSFEFEMSGTGKTHQFTIQPVGTWVDSVRISLVR